MVCLIHGLAKFLKTGIEFYSSLHSWCLARCLASIAESRCSIKLHLDKEMKEEKREKENGGREFEVLGLVNPWNYWVKCQQSMKKSVKLRRVWEPGSHLPSWLHVYLGTRGPSKLPPLILSCVYRDISAVNPSHSCIHSVSASTSSAPGIVAGHEGQRMS